MKKKLIFVLLFACSFANPQQAGIGKFVRNIVGYYEPAYHPLPADSLYELRFSFFDVYRKKINGLSSLSLSESLVFFAINLPPLENDKIKFRMYLTHNEIKFNNEKDLTSVITDYPISYNNIKLRIKSLHGRNILQVDIGYGLSNSKGLLFVKSYPTSKDESANKFLYDWLEPSFGKELQTSLDFSRFNVSAAFLDNNYRLKPGITVSKTVINSEVEINYVNTSNKPELRGRRKLSIPVSVNSTSLALYIKPSAVVNTLLVSAFDDKIMLNTDNHPPAFTDFNSLGYFKFYRLGVLLSSGFKIHKTTTEAGLSWYNFDARLDMHTPVLGYYLKILPISHGVVSNINDGEAYFFHLIVRNEHKLFLFCNRFKISYFHGYITIPVEGDAELEFGLVSAPIDTDLKYKVQLLEFNYNVSIPIKRTIMNIAFDQFIPVVKRLDRGEISFRKKYPGRKISHRGGRLFSMYIFFPI